MDQEPAANQPIRFVQTPNTRFYMCHSLTCRNHVLSSENHLYKDLELNAIICQNPVNVLADDVESFRLLHRHPVVDVYCNECGSNLGQKFVMVALPTRVVQEGRFIFYLNRMLYWNGNQVVYADTNQPVEDN